jgi:hypothetical protein
MVIFSKTGQRPVPVILDAGRGALSPDACVFIFDPISVDGHAVLRISGY